jgi:hypothetical protein
MSPHSQANKTMSRARLLVQRFTATFSILCVVIYLGFVAVDGWEFWHKARRNELQGSVAEYQQQMQEAVGRLSDDVKKVDAIRLGRVYTETLDKTDCTWLFVCHERVIEPNSWVTYKGYRMGMHLPEPPFTTMVIPTGRTIRGTPHALGRMAAAIVRAGGWAIAMFLACTVIWIALFGLVVLSDTGSKTMLPSMMPMGSPLFIPLLVWCVQWAAVAAMDRLGWAVALAAHVAAYSSALAVLVGIRHVWKTPHELRELTEVLREPA